MKLKYCRFRKCFEEVHRINGSEILLIVSGFFLETYQTGSAQVAYGPPRVQRTHASDKYSYTPSVTEIKDIKVCF